MNEICAVVRNDFGVLLEIRGEDTAAVRTLLKHAGEGLDVLDQVDANSDAAAPAVSCKLCPCEQSPAVAANGQVIAALAAFLQEAMPLVLQLIALFGKAAPPAPSAT